MGQTLRKAVFPVAGLGTRLLPATKAIPKEMVPIVDRPLIDYVVDEALAAGISHLIFVTGRGKGAIEDHFDTAFELETTMAARGKEALLRRLKDAQPAAGLCAFTRQPAPLGLGHAVWCARELVGDEPFAVLLPDELVLGAEPCLARMAALWRERGGMVVAVHEVPRAETRRYGVLDIESDDGQVAKARGVVEKPEPAAAPSTLSLIGRYILPPEIFAELARHHKGAGGEIQLTDGIAALIGRFPLWGQRVAGERLDCGDALGFIKANLAFGLARPELAPDLRAHLAALTGN